MHGYQLITDGCFCCLRFTAEAVEFARFGICGGNSLAGGGRSVVGKKIL